VLDIGLNLFIDGDSVSLKSFIIPKDRSFVTEKLIYFYERLLSIALEGIELMHIISLMCIWFTDTILSLVLRDRNINGMCLLTSIT